MYKNSKNLVKFLAYPVLLITVICIVAASIEYQWNYKTVYGATTVFLVLSMMALESIFPLKSEWSMTKKSFLRDIKYLAIDAPTIILTKSAFGVLAIAFAERHQGLLSQTNILLGTVTYLLIFEFFQYWFHRLSHQNPFLWKIHLAHHLPDKVYVIMHGVFNPLNILVTTSIIQSTIVLLGVSPEIALATTLLIDLQSLISHFNVDIRAGFLNYLFIGPETHRFHHSAKVQESQNFGNTLAIWDLIFGTFYYRPGDFPEALGVDPALGYPDSADILTVIGLPIFNRRRGHK